MSKRPQLNSLLRVLALARRRLAVSPGRRGSQPLHHPRAQADPTAAGRLHQESGIKVNTVFVKDGLLERVKAEGAKSPADVLTVDIGNLLDLVDGGVTQPVKSETLESVIPANLRGADDKWYALSLRDRVLRRKDLKLESFRYEDLADPKWKGKVCILRPAPYNTAMIASMIAHDGAEATEKWLRGVKANLARKAAGGDRVARDILGGICDIGLPARLLRGSHEERRHRRPQVGRRHQGDPSDLRQRQSGGTHVNVSGAAVAAHARPTPLNCWITWCPSPPRRCMPRPTMNTRCARA